MHIISTNKTNLGVMLANNKDVQNKTKKSGLCSDMSLLYIYKIITEQKCISREFNMASNITIRIKPTTNFETLACRN